jgi:signal transduction histidine kinase
MQILSNLLTNAGKFTQNGTVSLVVEQTPSELRIEVADTGIGIPEHECDRIFEWFRKVDTSDARKYEGSGLGLAISKGFCEMMGGSIAVRSVLGEGSTFTVVIPLPQYQRPENTSWPLMVSVHRE